MNNLTDYDFLGSIYKNTKSCELEETFESIKNQTHKPKNIFLVIDGFIEDNVHKLVKKYSKLLPIKIIPIRKNIGLGSALRKGLKKCESKIVLRFDTDDINSRMRSELIVKELEKGDVDIVGSNIYEFDHNNIRLYKKRMPLSHKAISRAIMFRNPINHPSVGFLRNSILKLNGGYRHFPLYEDYDLWIRALHYGLIFRNIDKELVAIRITNQRARRRGINVATSEFKLLITFFNESFFHGLLFIPSCFLRIIFALLPLRIFKFLFKKFFRNKISNKEFFKKNNF